MWAAVIHCVKRSFERGRPAWPICPM
jgi:hypothetical protein